MDRVDRHAKATSAFLSLLINKDEMVDPLLSVSVGIVDGCGHRWYHALEVPHTS